MLIILLTVTIIFTFYQGWGENIIIPFKNNIKEIAVRIFFISCVWLLSVFIGVLSVIIVSALFYIKINFFEIGYYFFDWYSNDLLKQELDNYNISAYALLFFIIVFIWVYYQIFKSFINKFSFLKNIIENKVCLNDFNLMIIIFGLLPFVIDTTTEQSLIGDSIKLILASIFIFTLVPTIYLLYKKEN